MKRIARALGSLGAITVLSTSQLTWTPQPARSQVTSGALCATPGKDGVDTGTLSIVNTYYEGPSTTTTVSAGNTSISVGPINAAGNQTTISPGDLLLIVQMQDADINFRDTNNYGGNNGTGSGYTALNRTGLYEYVIAKNSVGTGGGTIQIQGASSGGGLINSYRQEAASITGFGQRTYQVVRVPQYTSTTLTGTIRSPGAWNGKSGGIVAVDVASTLTLSNGTIEVQDKGFRGGGGTTNTNTYPAQEDEAYRTDGDVARGGMKGEGIAGTPLKVFDGANTIDTGIDGYPRLRSQDSYTTVGTDGTANGPKTEGGSRARGAPGNAGGGGNQHNAGGGGGGNWGTGGQGGNSIKTPSNNDNTPSTGVSKPIGGKGGTAIPATVSRLVMGGGGGAGDANNGIAGSGGLGGGIIMIRAGSITGTGAISAKAKDGIVTPTDDGGSGAGAGGSILIQANSGSLDNIVLYAQGGKGGDTNTLKPIDYDFGPGGGGGGGVIFSSLPVKPSNVDVSGGQPGKTFNGLLGGTTGVTRGANAGTAGKVTTGIAANQVPGVLSGADCSVQVSGRVWKDTNASLIQESGETGTNAGGLYVYLVDSNNKVFAKATVQPDGTYSLLAPINTANLTLRLSTDGSKQFGDVAPVVSLPTNWANTGENKNGTTETITPGEIAITTTTTAIANQSFGINFYELSPSQGQIVINEVLYRQSKSGTLSAGDNDEFIELYNASGQPIDLNGWQLIDGNLIANSTDGASGGINGSGAYVFGSTTGNPVIVTSGTTVLAPNQYAVIWIGSQGSNTQATGATFQAWLGKSPRLNDDGDDVWLYDSQTKIVDYMAYGSSTAVNTLPPTSINLWNSSNQADLAGASNGQSISLTPNGQDGNTSACWEQTTTANANSPSGSPRCATYLPTRDTDSVSVGMTNRVTSVGMNNNGSLSNILLVKRITLINDKTTTLGGDDLSAYKQDDAYPYDDNTVELPITHPFPDTNKWLGTAGKTSSTFLLGGINGGSTKPNDVIEYTIYFLSNGYVDAKNTQICDRIPKNLTFVPNAFNSESAASGGGTGDRGILLSQNGTFAHTNIADGDQGQYYLPGEPLPASCGTALNDTGAVVVNLGNVPFATGQGTPNTSYGYVRFRAKVN
jgi:uncharacterized repeat protein (TIGR01451 family)